MKTITLTEKELDKKLAEARQESYNMGLEHGRADRYPYKTQVAIRAVHLTDALLNLLDERYELKHEDYD